MTSFGYNFFRGSEEYPESANEKEYIPASKILKTRLKDRARLIAKTGRTYRPIGSDIDTSEINTPIPGKPDTLSVVAYGGPSKMPKSIIPKTSDEWGLAWDAFRKSREAARANVAFEREAGINFFNQQDAEDLQALMSQTWPQFSELEEQI